MLSRKAIHVTYDQPAIVVPRVSFIFDAGKQVITLMQPEYATEHTMYVFEYIPLLGSYRSYSYWRSRAGVITPAGWVPDFFDWWIVFPSESNTSAPVGTHFAVVYGYNAIIPRQIIADATGLISRLPGFDLLRVDITRYVDVPPDEAPIFYYLPGNRPERLGRFTAYEVVLRTVLIAKGVYERGLITDSVTCGPIGIWEKTGATLEANAGLVIGEDASTTVMFNPELSTPDGRVRLCLTGYGLVGLPMEITIQDDRDKADIVAIIGSSHHCSPVSLEVLPSAPLSARFYNLLVLCGKLFAPQRAEPSLRGYGAIYEDGSIAQLTPTFTSTGCRVTDGRQEYGQRFLWWEVTVAPHVPYAIEDIDGTPMRALTIYD